MNWQDSRCTVAESSAAINGGRGFAGELVSAGTESHWFGAGGKLVPRQVAMLSIIGGT